MSSLTHFKSLIQKYPVLSLEEEGILIQEWKATHRTEAAQKIIQAHLRVVFKVANQLRFYGLPIEDLLSEGCLGLYDALDRFDPLNGARFTTYAQWWVRARIMEYILRNWSIVQVSLNAQYKKLFFRIQRLINEDGEDHGEDENVTLAKELGMSVKAVNNLRPLIERPAVSLNLQVSEDSTQELQDFIESPDRTPEEIYTDKEEDIFPHNMLKEALKSLDERERRILLKRYLKDATLADLAEELGISKERVRQIEAAVLKKMKKFFKEG